MRVPHRFLRGSQQFGLHLCRHDFRAHKQELRGRRAKARAIVNPGQLIQRFFLEIAETAESRLAKFAL
jgi:hypothetical protein